MKAPVKTVHVAVGVVWRDGRILIARRPHHAHQGGLLEFPGGKVEPGESVQQALCRELAEETAVVAVPESMEPLIGIRHDYGDKRVFLDVWAVHDALGEARGLEGQPVFWMIPGDLKPEDFPAANRPILTALRLPRTLAITGDSASPEEAIARFRGASAISAQALAVVRMPSLTRSQYASLVNQLLAGIGGDGPGILVHDRPDLVQKTPVAGIHMGWRQAQELGQRPVGPEHWFGVSCHNEQELAHAAAIGADYATLGPVLATRSHPGAVGIGWSRFEELAGQATLPVYALGGVSPDLLSQALASGAQGIAGISFWWSSTPAEPFGEET